MKDLLEAGVHFGHQTKRWNPKMKPYIFGERNGIYILDLGRTAKLYREAAEFVTNVAREGGTSRLTYVGGSDLVPAYMDQISLEKDAAQTLRVRIGQCEHRGGRTVDCSEPTWIGGVQVVNVDTRLPDPSLALGFPGDYPCIANGDVR